MTKDLLDCYKNSKKLMPLVHLPIQSGSDKILKLMNRKHKVEEYISTFNYLKKINEKIEFSSDFIIGYPGEEIEDFENTIKLVNTIKFINSFSFIFSARPGTTASKLKPIDDKVSKERLKIVQEKLFEYQKLKNKSFEDKYIDVLVENEIKGQNKLFGRNVYMNSVIFEGSKSLIGKVVQVRVVKTNQNTLIGEFSNKNKFKAA
jgi:2-methylthioadenine synthetase